MSKTLAIIDCGTNTFNLLVVEVHSNGSWERILSTKIPVKLAPSPTTGKIGSNRFGRGLDALFILKQNLINTRTRSVFAFATSAIRESVNGRDFVEAAREKVGLDIRIITGDEEAQLIYLGVRQCTPLGESPQLIMDIGGGSVEFVIANQEEVFWKQSLPIGVSRLKGTFLPDNPITEQQAKDIQEYLSPRLEGLKEAIAKHQPQSLLGSSGTFDTLRDMLGAKYPDAYPTPFPCSSPIQTEHMRELSEVLRASTLDERLVMPGLVPMRADMIVMSMLLIDAVLDIHPFETIRQVSYALKEGAVAHLISEEHNLEPNLNPPTTPTI
jgi:exopolyphosphatase/guanosine-5'-triphosphate,3'-diphosphate pyrophosphatase